jgi:hypothetical protein
MTIFRLATVAAAAIAAAGSANALTIPVLEAARADGSLKEIRIAGASALRLSVAAYAKEICNAADFHVMWNSNAEGTGYRAYSCTLANAVGNYAAGTPILLYKRDAGGSGQGVNPIATAADQTSMIVNNTCTTINGGNTPATDAAVPNFICANTETTGIKHDAGISDVEPALLQANANLPSGTTALTTAQLANLDVAPLAQALFGVVVNLNTYRARQEAQGIIAPGGALIDVPADQSTWTAANIATIPSLPATFVRAMQNGQLQGGSANTANKRGWNLVIPASVDADAVNRTLNICRRTEGSGTQAISNAFFATNPCNIQGSASTPLGVAGSTGNESTVRAVAAGTPIVIQEGTSAGQVENCVGADAQAPLAGTGAGAGGVAYAIGFLGRESNPQRGTGNLPYRYVKLDGVAPLRSEAQVGNYPIVYEATMQWNKTTVPANSDKEAFLKATRIGFGTPNALAAVDQDTQQGVLAPPATYSGPWVDLTGNAKLFASRVARVGGNSCAPLRIVK